MIKFLSIVTFFTMSYLAILAFSKYDANISFLIFDYKIEVSLFVIILTYIFTICLFSLGFRVIGTIFKIPYLIAKRLAGYKKNNYIKSLLDAYAYLIIGKDQIAKKIISKISANTTSYKEFADDVNLLKSIGNNYSDNIIPNQFANKQYHDFIVRKISERMYNQNFYEQSLGFLENSNIDLNAEPETIYLLTKLYAALDIWGSFKTYMEKYCRNYSNLLENKKNEIASLYIKGAKYYLYQGEEENTVVFLEESLKYDPINIEAIEIFCTLNIGKGHKNQNIVILESAFSAAPSFELFELYYRSTSLNPEDLYDRLNKLADDKMYKEVFLSIAAYLKLFDKIDELLKLEE